MAKKATTLFIRDTSINLLVVKGKQVDKWGSAPLEPGLVSQGLITDEDRVAEMVRELFKEQGVGMTDVITALSGHDSLYRIITLPDVPDAVLPEAVRREARRTIPTPLEEVYYSYQQVPGMTGEKRVFLATYPRASVDALLTTLRKAGIRPHVMDLAPLALCRVPDVPRSIIVNARLDHLEVMVVADRLPQVIRRLSLPGEAESLEEKLPLFAEEFSRTVTFYNSGHMETPLDESVPVFVCGDLAAEPETWKSLVGGREHPVSTMPSPVEAPEGFETDRYMVNIGLALRETQSESEGASFSLVNFNALPASYLPKQFSPARVIVPVGIAIGIGVIVLGTILLLTTRAQTEALRLDLAKYEGEVGQLQRNIADLNREIGRIGPAADALTTLSAEMEMDRALVAMDLSELHRLAGDRVSLGSISHNVNTITVNAGATSEDNIFAYARAIRRSDRFSNVWIRSITRSGRGDYTFVFDVIR